MQPDGLILGLCRGTVAFTWFYHGLVPKLLGPEPDELAMVMATGLPEVTAIRASHIAGIAEIIFAVSILVFWRHTWPMWISLLMMPVLLGFVVLYTPQFLGTAFNPVTTNLAVAALSAIAIRLQRSQATL